MTIRHAGRLSMLAALAACQPEAAPPAPPAAASPDAEPPAEEIVATVSPTGSGLGEPDLPPDSVADTVELNVIAEPLPYGEVGAELVYGHFAFPGDMIDPLPGIILVHEWWGLDDAMRKLAERLAAEGFVVLAVDLYGGRQSRQAAEARSMMVELTDDPSMGHDNVRQAHAFLENTAQADGIAVFGLDLGGGLALDAALDPALELDAAVIYYAPLAADEARLEPLDVPILGHFGELDRSVPLADIRAFEETMESLGKVLELEIYPGAGHSFADPAAAGYDAAAAGQAWNRTVEFLREYLQVL